jgi:outer membrane receptor protein involved in Fe transport
VTARHVALIALALLVCFAAALNAQQNVSVASLRGVVVDDAHQPLAGVHVTAENGDTNQRQRTVTDANGTFHFSALPLGSCRLTAETTGLVPATRTLSLTIGSAMQLELILSRPARSETMVVTAAAPLVETARTQVMSTITPREVHDLPLNGRNYLDLALLAPGVSRTNTGANQRFAETSAVPGTGISVSSQRNLANSFVVDGLSANDDAAELAGTFFSQEVIREFAVIRSSGIAEFGRASAGTIDIATQSGTNSLRGNAYGYARNERFDARNALASTKLPLDQRQYGLSLGGPLLRDRTFFFANVERLAQDGGGLTTISPSNVVAINARLDASGYRGPRISSGNFDTTLDTTNWFARLDDGLSAGDQLMARYSRYDVSSSNARSAGGLNDVSRATSLEDGDENVAIGNMLTIGEQLFSETRAQQTRSRLDAPPNDLTGPAVTISGIASFGTATSSPTLRDIDMSELAQNVSFTRGEHALKAGADWLQNRVRIGFPGALQGVYSFSSLTNFLAGRYSSYQQAFGAAETRQTNDNVGVFIEDEWHASPRLTFNAGVRYDVQFLPLVHADRDNLAPRAGVAWDPAGNGNSVFRASGGVYYDRVPLRAIANALQRNGVDYRVAQVGPNDAGAPLFPNTFTTFPSGVLTNVSTIDPRIQSARSLQSSIQYEQRLGETFSASLGYEHLRGRNLIMARNINVPATTNSSVPNLGRPDSSVANNVQYQSIGDSWYDGVTIALVQRPAPWGNVRLSYTFSKALDTAGNFFFSQPQDAGNVRAERGRSDNDQRHRLTLSGIFTTPAATHDSLLHAVTRGWLVSYVFSYASALPFNVQLPTDRNGDTNFNDRPVGVGRNSGHGFDYQSLDVRVSRVFAAIGSARLEGIADVFNVFDRTNYQVPNNISTSPTFGQPTAANDPREVQLGVRVEF